MITFKHKIPEDTNEFIVTEDRSMVAWCWGGERDYKGHKETFGSDGYLDCGGGFFHTHAHTVCMRVKTYYIVSIKYVQLIVYELFLNKAV